MPAHLLRADKVVTLDAQDTIINDGYLIIETGEIVEIGAQATLGNRHFDQESTLGARLVMPGLVNAHTHTPMTLFRGHAEGHSLFTLEGWYNAIRVLEQKLEPEMLPPAVAVSCAEMIRTGTTCFADQYFWSDQIVPQVRKSGLRASIAYGIVELGDDTARAREIAAATAFLETLRDDPLIDGWLGPHAFFVDNTEDAMAQEMALADRFNTGMHIHLATDTSEDDYCQEKYGRTAIQQMHEMGVLDRRIIAAHAITVHDEDLRLLAGKPFTVVVAASSAMRNAAGTAPLRAMVDAGVNTALGTDNVTNNNSYDMFKEMQIAAKVNTLRELTPNAVATRAILDMA
ncbi:MAG: amidohydrolase family protein, partial [Anaerolineae bacterium]|nr:amidohydrolase family protein [Anaerolineae bacterium]